jgi:hypothetical protein
MVANGQWPMVNDDQQAEIVRADEGTLEERTIVNCEL